tara:strand:+ start:1239 stop:1787 length:549 start_codon:yes stop_codon:yes gene_type:complete
MSKGTQGGGVPATTGGGTNPNMAKAGAVASAIPPQAWFYIIGIPLGIGGLYFLVYRPIMKKLNILKTDEDEASDKVWTEVKKQPYWDGNYYKQRGGNTLSPQEANDFASTLYTAMKGGLFGMGTDEHAINGVFSALGSKGNISQVSEAYNLTRGADLVSDLDDELDEAERMDLVQKISMYLS